MPRSHMASGSSPSSGSFRETTPAAHNRGTRMMRGQGGEFKHILAHLRCLLARGLPRGYYPEPTKIILVVAPRNVARSEEFFWGMGIQVVTGHRYLGGFIGDREAEKRWLTGKLTGWAESMETLAGVSCKHPQSVYAELQKSFQQEWAFVQ